MTEILDFIKDYGFPIVMCLLLFFKMLPRLDKIDENIIKDSANTKEVKTSINGLKDTIDNHLVHSMNNLTAEIRKMNGKK